MSYNSTTKVITAAVSVYDVQQALGVGASDVGTLCVHTNINKWAKWKPVRYSPKGPLTDAQFEHQTYIESGQTIDTYYGLLVNNHLTNISTDMHDLSYEYKRPVGGSDSPYRLTDFVQADSPRTKGYCHMAQPTLGGVLDYDVLYTPLSTHPRPIQADIAYTPTSDYGIDIMKLGIQSTASGRQYYICCMLTFTATGSGTPHTYWRVMYNSTTSNLAKSDFSSAFSGTFTADLPSAIASETGTGKLSVFVLDATEIDRTGSPYSTGWNTLSGVDQHTLTYTPLPLPGVIGVNVQVRPEWASITFTTVSLTSTKLNATVNFSQSISESEADNYGFSATVDDVRQTSLSKTYIQQLDVVRGAVLEWTLDSTLAAGTYRVIIIATRGGLSVGSYDAYLTV